MMLICPRCFASGMLSLRADHYMVFGCRKCGAIIADESNSLRLADTPESDGPQRLIWRQGSRRCELWAVEGAIYLRVYDGKKPVIDEPFVGDASWTRAMAIRLQPEMSGL